MTLSLQWKDNWFRILALLMAVLLWLYVSNEQNPVTDLAYNNVPLTVQGRPSGYVIQGVPETVNLRVKGSRNVIGMLQKRDFTAYLQIPGDIHPGQWKLPVQVLPLPGVEVVRITPREVQVQIDQIVSKNLPVVVNLKGDPVPGLRWGEPVLRPSQVVVQGPSQVLEKINEVSVTVDVTGATGTLEREVTPAIGARGVTVQPGRVTVTVPVTNWPVQNLPVRVNITGEPADGYEVNNVSVNPPTVQVTGQDGMLQGLTAVSTAVLDITGLSGDLEREVKLELPTGANLVEPRQVLVTVRVTPLEEETRPAPNGGGDSDASGAGEKGQ